MIIKWKNSPPTNRNQKGFTLVEVVVTLGLVIFLSVLVINKSSNLRVTLQGAANVAASDIRFAQAITLSSKQYKGIYSDNTTDPAARNRCGFGVSQLNTTTYVIYAGAPTVMINGTTITNCPARVYTTGTNASAIYQTVVLDSKLDMPTGPSFNDIFFEPPGATTYIQGSSTSQSFSQIMIKRVGTTRAQCTAGSKDCIFVCAYSSGRVQVNQSPCT